MIIRTQEITDSSEMLATLCQITRRPVPETCNIQGYELLDVHIPLHATTSSQTIFLRALSSPVWIFFQSTFFQTLLCTCGSCTIMAITLGWLNGKKANKNIV